MDAEPPVPARHPGGYEVDNLWLGAASALVVACFGGFVWAMVAGSTGLSFGVLAVGVGAASGAMMASMKPPRTLARALVAVLCTLVGILFGMYLIFRGQLERGEASSPALSADALAEFFGAFPGVLTFAGVVFALIALPAAWFMCAPRRAPAAVDSVVGPRQP